MQTTCTDPHSLPLPPTPYLPTPSRLRASIPLAPLDPSPLTGEGEGRGFKRRHPSSDVSPHHPRNFLDPSYSHQTTRHWATDLSGAGGLPLVSTSTEDWPFVPSTLHTAPHVRPLRTHPLTHTLDQSVASLKMQMYITCYINYKWIRIKNAWNPWLRGSCQRFHWVGI